MLTLLLRNHICRRQQWGSTFVMTRIGWWKFICFSQIGESSTQAKSIWITNVWKHPIFSNSNRLANTESSMCDLTVCLQKENKCQKVRDSQHSGKSRKTFDRTAITAEFIAKWFGSNTSVRWIQNKFQPSWKMWTPKTHRCPKKSIKLFCVRSASATAAFLCYLPTTTFERSQWTTVFSLGKGRS
jgi:hypothetical protein